MDDTYALRKDLGGKNFEKRCRDRAKKFQRRNEKNARGESPAARFSTRSRNNAKYVIDSTSEKALTNIGDIVCDDNTFKGSVGVDYCGHRNLDDSSGSKCVSVQDVFGRKSNSRGGKVHGKKNRSIAVVSMSLPFDQQVHQKKHLAHLANMNKKQRREDLLCEEDFFNSANHIVDDEDKSHIEHVKKSKSYHVEYGPVNMQKVSVMTASEREEMDFAHDLATAINLSLKSSESQTNMVAQPTPAKAQSEEASVLMLEDVKVTEMQSESVIMEGSFKVLPKIDSVFEVVDTLYPSEPNSDDDVIDFPESCKSNATNSFAIV
jgi:hypothetical protein